MKRKWFFTLVIVMLSVFTLGCQKEDTTADKVRDLDFTVVATENIPDELMEHVEEEKTQAFYRTYSDGDFMYLCVGYGEQETGGYSIAVNELYLTEDSVCLDTTLMGPGPGEEQIASKSYPYIVICTEYIDCPVIFE